MPLGAAAGVAAHDPHIVVGTPGPRAGAPEAQKACTLRRHQDAGARRGRSHARHGLRRGRSARSSGDAEAAPDPAVLGDLSRTRSARSAARCSAIRSKSPSTAPPSSRRSSSSSTRWSRRASPTRWRRCCCEYSARVGALVFCNMRRDVDALAQALERRGFSRAGAARRHGAARPRRGAGALRQPQLQRAGRHRRRRARARHRTTLAAVVNYDSPPDPDTHLHRIGRTGRAGRGGPGAHPVSRRASGRAAANIEEASGTPLPLARS